MDSNRKLPPTKATASKRVTYALAGAGLAVMALPLVTAVLPGEAGATRVPSQQATTSLGVTSVVPTDPTVPRSTLAGLSGTIQTFTVGTTTYTVSSGICTVEVIVSGAAGGTINDTIGGRGASIKGQFSVAAGDKYDITVGGYRANGGGGLASLGGGASSKIVKQSTLAVIVEAGGGGGDSLGLVTRINASQDTIPGATTSVPGQTYPPFIKWQVVPGKGADASNTTAVSPITASVNVPVGDLSTPGSTSTSLVNKSVSASANGAGSDAGQGNLVREVAPSTTEFIAGVKVDVYAGGNGGGGLSNKGGADADGGSAGSILYPTTTVSIPDPNPPVATSYSAPYAVGAAVGGSGGINFIGNGFLKTAEGVNDQADGKVTLRQIACSSSGSTLPPLGGRGASSPLLPAALALVGAGIGMLVVRRRGTKLASQA